MTSSTLSRQIAAVSDSSVNQDTRMPASITRWVCLDEVGLPGPRRSGDGEILILRVVDPFQSCQGRLGRCRGQAGKFSDIGVSKSEAPLYPSLTRPAGFGASLVSGSAMIRRREAAAGTVGGPKCSPL